MTNKEYKIYQQEQALKEQIREYIEDFDSYYAETNEKLVENIKLTDKELSRMKKERKKDAIRYVQLQQKIEN